MNLNSSKAVSLSVTSLDLLLFKNVQGAAVSKLKETSDTAAFQENAAIRLRHPLTGHAKLAKPICLAAILDIHFCRKNAVGLKPELLVPLLPGNILQILEFLLTPNPLQVSNPI
jgi:hypothetical protein